MGIRCSEVRGRCRRGVLWRNSAGNHRDTSRSSVTPWRLGTRGQCPGSGFLSVGPEMADQSVQSTTRRFFCPDLAGTPRACSSTLRACRARSPETWATFPVPDQPGVEPVALHDAVRTDLIRGSPRSLGTPQSRMNRYSSPRSNGFFVYWAGTDTMWSAPASSNRGCGLRIRPLRRGESGTAGRTHPAAAKGR